jgi:hypothetical protein
VSPAGMSSPPFVTWTEGEAQAAAERRLAGAFRAFRGMGAEVTGKDPVHHVQRTFAVPWTPSWQNRTRPSC